MGRDKCVSHNTTIVKTIRGCLGKAGLELPAGHKGLYFIETRNIKLPPKVKDQVR